MVLRLEAEEVTQYTDDLDADAKRDLLACLLHSVDEVLLFFRTVSQTSNFRVAGERCCNVSIRRQYIRPESEDYICSNDSDRTSIFEYQNAQCADTGGAYPGCAGNP